MKYSQGGGVCKEPTLSFRFQVFALSIGMGFWKEAGRSHRSKNVCDRYGDKDKNVPSTGLNSLHMLPPHLSLPNTI